MKTCPVCKTMLFDDMEVCYGCMYRFGSKPHLEGRERRQGPEAEGAFAPVPRLSALPFDGEGFCPLDLKHLRVRVEFRDMRDPGRAWSVVLSSADGEIEEAGDGGISTPASDDVLEKLCCEIE